jgi:DNA polymerase-3 subunit beta
LRIQIDQRSLSNHINIAQKGISSKTTLQILNGILLQTIGDKLKLTATDLEIGIETYVDCNILEEGSIVVNSKIFGDIIKKLPNSTINIEVKENNINIKCENSEFNILGSNPSEYPELPAIINKNSFNIPKDLFKSAIKQTVFATTQDETRPILTGVLLEIKDGIGSFVALDGYRLALRSIPINIDEEVKIVIPARALNELNKILDENDEELTITIAPGHVIFNMGETSLSSRLLEGQFLNYNDIIRKDHKTNIIVDRKDFQDSLERASLLANEQKANLVKLNVLEDQLIIKSNSEIGDVNEQIVSKHQGEVLNIAFNSKYILDGIKVIDSEEVELYFMGSLNPCIIKPIGDENYTYLVLPVRLAQDDY